MALRIDVEKQNEQIINMRNAGFSRQEMSNSLGISLSSLDRRISALLSKGLIKPVHYDSKFQNEKIIIWHSQGIACKEMAQRLGLTVRAVETRIRNLRKKGIITTYNKTGPKKKQNAEADIESSITKKLSLNQFNDIAHIYLEQKQYDKLIKLLEKYSRTYDLSESKKEQIAEIIKKLQKKNEKER